MTRIISPLARVQIGGKNGDVFVSGDGILQSVSVELGEDKRSSKCQVVLFDKDLLIGGKYQAISFAKGGIEVDPEVLRDTTESKPTVSSTPIGATSSSSEGSAKNTSLSAEERAFLDLIAYSEGTLGRGQEYDVIVGYRYFTDYSRHPDVYVKSQNSTAAGRYQFLNTTWNGQRGKPGLKQILGLKDFSPNSQDLGAIQLIKEQGALADVKRGSAGLETALYKCRAIWASFPASPYNQPRRQLSDLKNKYINFLLKYQSQSPAQAAAATQPQTPTTDKNQPAPLKDKANSKPIEQSVKGTEIIVELGFSLSQMIAFHFVHIGTNTTRGQFDQTTFEGQSIRWLLTRRTQNTAYTKITLRQLAQMICDRYGLRLEFEGNGPTYQYLDATGISDYELLLREAQAIGYSIRENANTLIIKPIRPNFTGFVITRDILQTIKFGDRASTDRASNPGTTTSMPAVAAAESKTKHDRKTGQPVQTRIENSTGTGTKTEAKAAVTGAPSGYVHGTTILDASLTGLPKQEIGAIDLADDRRAQAVDLQNEQRRVKGYESQASLITTPEILTIAPGSIIATSTQVAPVPFAREWRVSSIRHTLSTSGMRSELQFYSPQAQKEGSGAIGAGDATTAATPTSGQNSFIVPCSGKTGDGINGGGNGFRKHMGVDIANAGGTPIVASASGTIIKVVTGCRVGDLGGNGGYGNFISISHANGYVTNYAHLDQVFVREGQQVKQGEKIATMGTTGRSYPVGGGWHLHWEIRQGGTFGKALAPSDVGCKVPPPPDKRTGFRY